MVLCDSYNISNCETNKSLQEKKTKLLISITTKLPIKVNIISWLSYIWTINHLGNKPVG